MKALSVCARTSEVEEKSAGQCIQSVAYFDPISSIEDKENVNPVPSKQVSMPPAGTILVGFVKTWCCFHFIIPYY